MTYFTLSYLFILITFQTPRGTLDPLQDLLKTPDIREGFMPTVPKGTEAGTMQDVLARSYASWLFWWKNTLNGDDYNKYLSTQACSNSNINIQSNETA